MTMTKFSKKEVEKFDLIARVGGGVLVAIGVIASTHWWSVPILIGISLIVLASVDPNREDRRTVYTPPRNGA